MLAVDEKGHLELLQAILGILQDLHVVEKLSSAQNPEEIINIIKGDMCILGPRPALWNQYDLIEERDKYGANDIVPGLTGWAQINGRDELPIDVKAKLDGEYVERCSFGFDVKCFFLTFVKVLKRDGVVEGKTEEQIVAKQTNE